MIKHIYDSPITNEEIKNAATNAFYQGEISFEELSNCLKELDEKPIFDGKLTDEELKRLQDASFTEEQIREIEDFLETNKNVLSGFLDIVGDDLVPTEQFFFNIKHMVNY